MSLLATAVLVVVSYVLLEMGLTVLALIVFLIALLQAFSQPTPQAMTAGAAGAQRPVIVTTSGGKIPETIRIVTKNPWPGTDLYEDFTTYLGGCIEWPIRVLIRLFTGKAGKIGRRYGPH